MYSAEAAVRHYCDYITVNHYRREMFDNGVGIDPARLTHMFDAFAQERQDSDRSQGGLGLGLAIVRSLVEAHGGSVSLESEGRGNGTECVIRLPLAARGVRRASAPKRSAVPLAKTGVRVLLVDDNKDAADTLADSLRALGHHLRPGGNALNHHRADHQRHDRIGRDAERQ